jgi:hypothetical protein
VPERERERARASERDELIDFIKLLQWLEQTSREDYAKVHDPSIRTPFLMHTISPPIHVYIRICICKYVSMYNVYVYYTHTRICIYV